MRGEPRRVGAVMLRTAGVIGSAALALALTFAVAFEPAFLAFHAVFFPPGTFLFEPGSNLVTLFPEGFWFDASLAAGATIFLSARHRRADRVSAVAGRAADPAAGLI